MKKLNRQKSLLDDDIIKLTEGVPTAARGVFAYFRFRIDETDFVMAPFITSPLYYGEHGIPPPRNLNFIQVLSSCTHSNDDEICRVYPKSEVHR